MITAIVFSSSPFFMLSSLPSLVPSSSHDSCSHSILFSSFVLSASPLSRLSTCIVAKLFLGLLGVC
jgi:hypothetical protein